MKKIIDFLRKRRKKTGFILINNLLDKYCPTHIDDLIPSSFASIKKKKIRNKSNNSKHISINGRLNLCLETYRLLNNIESLNKVENSKTILIIGHATKANIKFNDLYLINLAMSEYPKANIRYFPVCQKKINIPNKVEIIDHNLSLSKLLNGIDFFYTYNSDYGFDALIAKIPGKVYGKPFYRKALKNSHLLTELLNEIFIDNVSYFCPFLKKK